MPDARSMLEEIYDLAKTSAGKPRVVAAVKLFAPEARKFSDLDADQIASVWAEVTTIPPDPTLTPDDSPEGRKLNDYIDSIRL